MGRLPKLVTIAVLYLFTVAICQPTTPTQASNANSATSCVKITCASINSQANCTLSDYPVLLTVDPTVCQTDQYCYINKRLDGYCVKRTSNTDPNVLYPGQPCVQGDNNNICAFGPQQCGSDGRCVGYNVNQACVRTADCNYGYYCLRGFCSPTGDQCTTSDACGRTGFCYYSTLNTPAGICTPFFSFDDGDTVGVNVSVVQTGAERLCRNQMVNMSSGQCTSSLSSSRAGQNCTTSNDCPTTDPSQFANCNCGYTVGGQKFCDAMGQDAVWQTANQAFQAYFFQTMDCHVGAGWSGCGQQSLYQAWQCAQFQAQYYVQLIGNPPCVQSMYANFPLFQTYAKYCLVSQILATYTLALIGILVAILAFNS